MGCGTSRSMPAESGEEKHSKSVRTSRPSKAIGIGRPVGGGTRAADKREAQLEAAEKRAAKAASRGLGTPTRGKELNQSSKKQELIGRIHALYNVCFCVCPECIFFRR